MDRIVNTVSSKLSDLRIYRDIAAVVGVAYLSKYAIRSLLSLWSGFRAYYPAPWGLTSKGMESGLVS